MRGDTDNKNDSSCNRRSSISNTSDSNSPSTGIRSSSTSNESFPMSSRKEKILLLGGGVGTHLETLGVNFRSSPLWASHAVISHPELVQRAIKDFYDAGADVGYTTTYQMYSAGFAKLGYSPLEAANFVQRAIYIADQARQQARKGGKEVCQLRQLQMKLLLLSCGPYGASLCGGQEYTGQYTDNEEELRAFHRWRIEAALTGENSRFLDGISIATVPKLAEAKAVLPLLRQFPELRGKVWISFSCKSPTELGSGENFRECAAEILRLDAYDKYVSGIGVNCSPLLFVPDLVLRPPLLHWFLSAECPPSASLRKTRDVVGEPLRVLCSPNSEPAPNIRAESMLAAVRNCGVSDTACLEECTSRGTQSSYRYDRDRSSVPDRCNKDECKEDDRQRSVKNGTEAPNLTDEEPEDVRQLERNLAACAAYDKAGRWEAFVASIVQAMHSGEHMGVGGCCGTRPRDIQQLAKAAHSLDN